MFSNQECIIKMKMMFLDECKKISLYDTGIEAQYGEQLLTLSTCEYSQKNGRFVIVAKKVK